METFLGNVARFLYGEYGENISSVGILLPNVRSRLFLMQELGRLIDKPLWQPRYFTIEEIMGRAAGLSPVDPVRAVAELYKIYSRSHCESFDSFYFWGEILLNDFDQVDKYMVDADMLFTNLSDLKNIDDTLGYFTTQQRDVVRRFWEAFGAEESYSSEKRDFLKIWQSLRSIYHEFRDRLSGLGLAYPGMMQRTVAEKIKRGDDLAIGSGPFAVVGFNALSKCEKMLFDHLKNGCDASFFWDCDDYYTTDKRQEAGTFIRENIGRYGQPAGFVNRTDNFVRTKKITVVSAPSGVLQCKYAADFLGEVVAKQGGADKETAIVLTDESLLVPLLYSIPPEVGGVNVTMGYPLRQTLAYSFVERLLRLQSRTRDKSGEPAFYHTDVSGILTHPFVMALDMESAAALQRDITTRSRIYVRESLFECGGVIEQIFTKKEDWRKIADWITEILSTVVGSDAVDVSNGDNLPLMREYAGLIADTLRKLSNSIEGCGIEMDVPVFASLVRRVLQSQRVPYEGEPLQGVQVMGVLETRNIDFENVMIMALNEDNFPGNTSASSSFIPYNLRLGYGLPTPQLDGGIRAYYFYRLLQRCSHAEMVYSSRNDDNSSGEPSRYIYQLEYESPHKIVHREIGLDVGISVPDPISIDKDSATMERLEEFLDDGGRLLSPTALNTYLDCPLKFYFRYVAGLQPEEDVSEEIDMPMFGTILHKTMELLYRPLVGVARPWVHIAGLVGTGAVTDAVDRAVGEVYFHGERVKEDEYEGNLLLVRDIVIRYLNGNLLPFDGRTRDYEILALEHRLTSDFCFRVGGKERRVTFSGVADRIDRLPESRIRIVDYKTGTPHTEFAGVGTLFGETSKERNPAILQTLLYSMIVRDMQQKGEMEGTEACPALYYVRLMNDSEYSPLLNISNGGIVTGYEPYREEFERYLKEVLAGLFSGSHPFCQCEDTKPCDFCDFIPICSRK